jgi:NarL family two-component system sensor histidine kinase LiaS
VTVGSLVFVLVLISIPLLTYILAPVDLMDPEYWVEEIYGGKYVEFMRQFLSQSPPDVFGARLLINNLDLLTETRHDIITIRDVSLSIRTVPKLQGAVVDADGTLLGATLGDLGETAYDLRDFKSRAYPAINQVMRAALSGETDVRQLSARDADQGALMLAIPVYQNSVSLNVPAGDRLLGAILIVVESLPSREFLPTYLLRTIGTGLGWFLVAAGAVGALFGFVTARYFERRFRRLYQAADHWSQGDFSELIQDRSTDELGQLADRMDEMARQLSGLLAEQQARAVTEERNRLARELHDSAKQQAFGAAFQLGSAISKLERDADKTEVINSLQQAQAAVDAVRRELTDLIHELNLPEMEGRSLADAIRDYATEWAHSHEIEIQLDVEEDQELALAGKQALYRVVQEALANVARHSQAARARIRLTYPAEQARLEIRDDGVGFDLNEPRRGLGLHSMRQRAEALGGRMEVESHHAGGTRIEIKVPLGR